MYRIALASIALVLVVSGSAWAQETVVQNDSATDGSLTTVVPNFIPDDRAAVWLTSPCDGDIVAVLVYWDENAGSGAQLTEYSISLLAPGTFPTPGSVLQNGDGSDAVSLLPTFTVGAFNEFRYLDNQAQTGLLDVPVTTGQTFVASLRFLNQSGAQGPSIVYDHDGCQADKNGFVTEGGLWTDFCTQDRGDWVIRAVVACEADPVPAASNWGLVILTVTVLAFGTVVLRRRRAIRA